MHKKAALKTFFYFFIQSYSKSDIDAAFYLDLGLF